MDGILSIEGKDCRQQPKRAENRNMTFSQDAQCRLSYVRITRPLFRRIVPREFLPQYMGISSKNQAFPGSWGIDGMNRRKPSNSESPVGTGFPSLISE